MTFFYRNRSSALWIDPIGAVESSPSLSYVTERNVITQGLGFPLDWEAWASPFPQITPRPPMVSRKKDISGIRERYTGG